MGYSERGIIMKTYSKKTVVNERDARNTELTDRLNHYNDWLMDMKRPLPSVYPGYPGDKGKKPTTDVVETPKSAPVKREKGRKSVMSIQTVGIKVARSTVNKGPKTGTKQAKAIEIVRKLGVEQKAQAIDAIMSELAMSKAGATTYFHNSRHTIAREASK
jgi:hypothetical protein